MEANETLNYFQRGLVSILYTMTSYIEYESSVMSRV